MAEPRPPKLFFGYPKPVEAPQTPFKPADDKNPVFSGYMLLIGSWLVSKLEFLQRYLWWNAGFASLRGLKYIDQYAERFDPTVIPLRDGDSLYPSDGTPQLDINTLQFPPTDLPARYYTVADYHAAYASGRLTPLAVAEALLLLIRRDIKPVSKHAVAFVEVHPEAVLEAARASTARWREKKPLSILDGIPTGVKDTCCVAGYRKTFGRKLDEPKFVTNDTSDYPVRKLQEAGVIVLGVLNMHELGSDTTGLNPHWGTPLNPHNPNYYTGGSSSGSGYAVAAGLVPFSVGADGGGSIRIPASFCGIYGLKPSHNRLDDHGSTVVVSGPLAASMADLEVSYKIMGQPDPDHPLCSLFSPPLLPSLNPVERPKVLGICRPWIERADPIVLKLVDSLISHYQTLGYTTVDIEIPYRREGQLAHAMTILSEMVDRTERQLPSASLKDCLASLTAPNKVLMSVGAQTPARDYLLAQQLRNLIMSHLAYLFKANPGMIIVTPTSPVPGWPVNDKGDFRWGFSDANQSIRNMEYVWLANFSGCPAISAPVGWVDPVKGELEPDEKGKVPIGIMGMGEWGDEEGLLQWGREAENWLRKGDKDGQDRAVRAGNWVDVFSIAEEKMGADHE
ncbi:amidase signature domain-containing protein [Xylogone sp. PMI_703]|nr:amidase signature domain-containing protein [Xylogone sp. PMI_703]